eukprot:PhM_4_TR15727/c0_g1_i1/m.88222
MWSVPSTIIFWTLLISYLTVSFVVADTSDDKGKSKTGLGGAPVLWSTVTHSNSFGSKLSALLEADIVQRRAVLTVDLPGAYMYEKYASRQSSVFFSHCVSNCTWMECPGGFEDSKNHFKLALSQTLSGGGEGLLLVMHAHHPGFSSSGAEVVTCGGFPDEMFIPSAPLNNFTFYITPTEVTFLDVTFAHDTTLDEWIVRRRGIRATLSLRGNNWRSDPPITSAEVLQMFNHGTLFPNSTTVEFVMQNANELVVRLRHMHEFNIDVDTQVGCFVSPSTLRKPHAAQKRSVMYINALSPKPRATTLVWDSALDFYDTVPAGTHPVLEGLSDFEALDEPKYIKFGFSLLADRPLSSRYHVTERAKAMLAAAYVDLGRLVSVEVAPEGHTDATAIITLEVHTCVPETVSVALEPPTYLMYNFEPVELTNAVELTLTTQDGYVW